jgi:serine protease Do
MRRFISRLGRREQLRAKLVSSLTDFATKQSIRFAFGLVLTLGGSFGSMSIASAADGAGNYSDRETPVVLAIRRCSGSVVNIHGQKTVRATAASAAGASGDAGRQVNGMGTGVVIDPRGYVITNYHVVEDVDQVQITLADGTTTTADVVATEIRSDLALLKVNVTKPLETIPRGTSSDLMVGEPVIAIGNAFGYVHTATEGIVSALHRDVPVNDTQEYRDLIQTSAGINPGNSGGPLLNIHGEIIGVNVAVRIGAQQIAFAIPIDQAIEIVTDMISSHNEDRLSIGMRTEGGPRDGDGVAVAHVAANSPAAKQGLQTGDRILQVGSIATDDRLDFGLALIELEPGEEVQMEIERDGQPMQLALTIDAPTGVVADDAQSLAWAAMGVRIQPVSKTAMQRINARTRKSYRGGLLVTEVRKGSPADSQGIRSGDVLIGLHGWSTASTNELQGILNKVSTQESTQGQFLIIRSDQAMYGYVRLAEVPGARKR